MIEKLIVTFGLGLSAVFSSVLAFMIIMLLINKPLVFFGILLFCLFAFGIGYVIVKIFNIEI